METAPIQKMTKPITDEQRNMLMQLIEAAKACQDWDEAKARLSAKRDIEKARSLTNLKNETAGQLCQIADQLLKNGSLTYEGMELLEPMIMSLRKQSEG